MPRERFLSQGAEALGDAELLAVLLRSGVHGMPVMRLAEELLASYGNNLLNLSLASPEELSRQHGMGQAKSIGLAAAFALGRRMVKLRMETQLQINSPELIADYIRSILPTATQEEFHVLLMDTHLKLIKDVMVSLGLVDRSLVHAREVFREAIRESCSGIIIAHNHPTGDVRPSNDDIRTTKYLITAGKIIGIEVIDHIIVATPQKTGFPSFFSFKEHKLLYE
ncbi:MAG: DNA repair protein RadC [Victivallales bacterium]|nr:DNA repair protein RadC [Victivallales bacterium]